jgi:hypothetical protein
LLPCDYNDIDSDIYDPSDKGVVVHEAITECDVLALTAEARGGGLDCESQRFLERLVPYQNLLFKQGQSLLDGKVAIVLIVGEGAESVSGQVSARLASLGFALAPRGVVALELPKVSRESGLKILNSSTHVATLLQTAAENAAYVARKLMHT